jgi:GMP synthase-like glutamine amidotransferase
VLPIAVFRFSPSEGPAAFGHWLDRQARAWQLVAIDAGDPVPLDPAQFAGIGMMGGPMSVNDDLPWLPPLRTFLRRAVMLGVPVIGHCLGGQLLAQALGARVARAAVPEIGWIDVEVTDVALAGEWLGGRTRFRAFQWHYEAFELPPGATPLLTDAYNPHQAYVIDGRHLGLQCHVEMTRELVTLWCDGALRELPQHSEGALQSRADMLRDVDARVAELARVADALYGRWAQGLRS